MRLFIEQGMIGLGLDVYLLLEYSNNYVFILGLLGIMGYSF